MAIRGLNSEGAPGLDGIPVFFYLEGGLFQGIRFLRLTVPVERTSVTRLSGDVGAMGEAVRNNLHFCHPR